MRNHTRNMVFILAGFSIHSDVQVTVFVGFLLIYIIALLANATVIMVIAASTKLHTPMYCFLCVLSCLDMVLVSATVPRLLKDTWDQKKHITFNECIVQGFVMLMLEVTDAFILTAMCYDRYIAICHPLRYTVLVSRRLCIEVVYFSCFCGFLFSFINTFLVLRLSFCEQNKIDNFLCELPAVLPLACADTLRNEIVLFALAGSEGVVTFTIIFISYLHIIRVILKIPSVEGKRKVFSTCSAHLMVVFLFFGAGACTHLTLSSSPRRQDKFVSLFYAVFLPMLNPLIYTLRNHEVKQALREAIGMKKQYN
ncbi:olfactory receptor 2C1-like [Ambystoma mexicanum]|uniref:olfactory receptor 2C1-like n=1 Tax=Ambystoma mexicanum TaxID=8296 RepID=UPI0037E81F39